MIASRIEDRGLDPWSGKTKGYSIGIRCITAANNINETAQTDWHGVSIVCLNYALCLPVYFCSSEVLQ